MSDGYAVYSSLARGAPEITPVHCWAHVRRKFIEAESSFPDECRKAIDWIAELYEVERGVPKLPRGAPEDVRADACTRRLESWPPNVWKVDHPWQGSGSLAHSGKRPEEGC